MASKRDLKRQVNYMIYDVIDECFILQENRPELIEQAEKEIDKAVNFHTELMSQISQAKTKLDFKPIIEKIEKKQDEFTDALNALNESK